MKREIDIYNYTRVLETELRGIEKANITKKNKKLILEFKDVLVRDNISVARVVKYMGTLKNIAVKILVKTLIRLRKRMLSVLSALFKATLIIALGLSSVIKLFSRDFSDGLKNLLNMLNLHLWFTKTISQRLIFN